MVFINFVGKLGNLLGYAIWVAAVIDYVHNYASWRQNCYFLKEKTSVLLINIIFVD